MRWSTGQTVGEKKEVVLEKVTREMIIVAGEKYDTRSRYLAGAALLGWLKKNGFVRVRRGVWRRP